MKKETMENHLQLAREAVQQKDYDTALDHLISVLQQDSNNSEAYGIMGDMALSRKDLDAAESYFFRQLELDAQSYEAHKNLGRLYWQRSDYESAISEFKMAMQQDPDHIHSDPYIYLASICLCLGQYEKSYEWLYRLSFELQKQMPQSNRDFLNQAYHGVTCIINDKHSVSDLDSLIQQLEAKHHVSITTQLVVNPDVPLMPFRRTGERSYAIDYDLDSIDKFYEVLTSLILLDNSLGGEHFHFHHFLTTTDDAREQFTAMTRSTMAADSSLSMADLLNYMIVDLQTTLVRIYTDEVLHHMPEFDKYRPIQWLGMGNTVVQSYNYVRRLERIHAPRHVIYVHKVLLYMKSCPLFEYFRASDKRIDFQSGLKEHKIGSALYNAHVYMKDPEKRKDWSAFYKAFVNQVCPVLRYYVNLEKI